jgi:hypothetical protein
MSNASSQPGTPTKDTVALVTGGHRGFDDTMRAVKSQLSRDVTALYAQLAAA